MLMQHIRAALLAVYIFAIACSPVLAANRYAVCNGTCTWDNTSTAMWCATDTGCTGATAPGPSDDVVFNANTCVGGTTCTITSFAGTISVLSIIFGACTASTTGCIVDASVNNTNFTLNGGSLPFSLTGNGTRKWLGGSGTYAITQNNANNIIAAGTTTNDQGTSFASATFVINGTTSAARGFAGGGFNYGSVTINGNSSRGSVLFTGNNSFSSLTVNGPNAIQNGGTQTISGALTLSGGTSSSPIYLGSNVPDSPTTISIGSASGGAWVAMRAITTSGAGTLALTNSFDLGRNTFANGGSISAPSTGGGGKPPCIGC